MSKVFVVLTTVLAVALSVLFISGAAQWQNWRTAAEAYQQSRDAMATDLQNTRAVAAEQLAMKEQTIRSLQDELRDAQDESRRLTDELARARTDLTTARNEALAADASRAKLEELLTVQTGELKSVQKQVDRLLAENVELQTRNARVNERNLELTTELTISNDQLRNLQEKLYLAEQQNVKLQEQLARGGQPATTGGGGAGGDFTSGAGASAQPTVKGDISGEIISVDGTYASINVGSSSGVVRGMTFMIWRPNAGYLGDLVVETVRPNEAGGKLTTQVSGEIRAGDRAAYEASATFE